MKFVSETDVHEVSTLNVLIYGEPGVGKSSYLATLEKPLILASDEGGLSGMYKRRDAILFSSWNDFVEIANTIQGWVGKGYTAICLDTVGHAMRYLSDHVAKLSEKNRNRSGGLSQQGYGVLKDSFKTWITSINLAGLDVIMTAHVSETKQGEETKLEPDVVGGSKRTLLQDADLVGYLYKGNNNQTVLDFNPTIWHYGKNRAEIEPVPKPNFQVEQDASKVEFSMQWILNQAKAKISERNNYSQQLDKQVREVLEEQKQQTGQTKEQLAKLYEEYNMIGGAAASELTDLCLQRIAEIMEQETAAAIKPEDFQAIRAFLSTHKMDYVAKRISDKVKARLAETGIQLNKATRSYEFAPQTSEANTGPTANDNAQPGATPQPAAEVPAQPAPEATAPPQQGQAQAAQDNQPQAQAQEALPVSNEQGAGFDELEKYQEFLNVAGQVAYSKAVKAVDEGLTTPFVVGQVYGNTKSMAQVMKHLNEAIKNASE